MREKLRYWWWLLTRHSHKWEVEPGVLSPLDAKDRDVVKELFSYGVVCMCNYSCMMKAAWGLTKEDAILYRNQLPKYTPEEPVL